MPITWTISKPDRMVTVRAEGIVTLKDVEELFDDLVVQDALPYRKLFDGRGSIGKYDDNDVMTLAARMSAYNSLNLTGAAAIVLGTPEHHAAALRFANIARGKRPIQLFYSPEEARAWLDSDPKVGIDI
jgi:hypothetical protein